MSYVLSVDVHAAIADPVRRQLLDLLRGGPHPAGVLADAFPISRPAISRHLRVLREAGLVQVEGATGDGRERIYRLDVGPLAEVEAWLAPFRVARPPLDVGAGLDALATEVHRAGRDRRRAAADPTAGIEHATQRRSTA